MGVTLLTTMNIILLLLCALAKQVTSQSDDIVPAKILAQQKTISENSDLYLTCSTFGATKHTALYVYLCKNDKGIIKKKQKEDQSDTTFVIKRVSLNDSGSYSCGYSTKSYLPSVVTKRGHSIIQIMVIANLLPADISVAGPSSVMEGDDVEFKCTVSRILQTLGECQLIHSYLKRNDSTILQVQAFNVTRMEATFTIQGADKRDSGPYSCVVLPSKCIQEHERTVYGNNTVLLEVKEDLVIQVMLYCVMITQMFSLGLCLWWINRQSQKFRAKSRGSSDVSIRCVVRQQESTNMLVEGPRQTEEEDLEIEYDTSEDSFSMEERVVRQQDNTNMLVEGPRQTEEEDLETDDDTSEDSFSMEERIYDELPAEDCSDDCGGSIYNELSAEDCSDDCGAVYSVADDSVARQIYARSFKRKKTPHGSAHLI